MKIGLLVIVRFQGESKLCLQNDFGQSPFQHPYPADAGCNSELAQYSNTPARNASRSDAGGPSLHHSDVESKMWTGTDDSLSRSRDY
jgi:hypothetical protein